MKQIKTASSLIILLFLYSCGYETAIFNSKNNPYVITSIVKYNNDFSRYYSNNTLNICIDNPFNSDKCIIAPTGMYNIGDTVFMEKSLNHTINN